eukprot:TRINITY_DN3685_c0_g1_i3.p1 TRINITY_DN3685_c0_g1~~TRINITY_DN3685_c0_g1_i3.p1  ORF type:complete len:528 (+),score=131.40 TRINITY_DN3685_c0_g1_i3:60-1586(+)
MCIRDRYMGRMERQKSVVLPKVYPTEKEQRIFDLLKEFVEVKKLGTTVRVAGGWVRDKLLGLDCDDLDFALDNMMGEEFITKAREFLTVEKNLEIHGFGVIKTNAEKSKHLQTATLQLFGQKVDFVNLRSETYEDNSRIPKIEIGTPEEDAYRRDLTINALFYNIMTDSVEDFTKKGIEDLHAGVCRTPLEPLATFTDDSLRVLRVFRFASRYDFDIVPEIPESLKNEEVRKALKLKVSRERIGIESHKALSHKNSYLYLEHVFGNGLESIVFEIPPTAKVLAENPILQREVFQRGFENATFINRSDQLISNYLQEVTKMLSDSERIFYLYLSAVLRPFLPYTHETKKKKEEDLISFILKESLKFTHKESGNVLLICQSSAKFDEILQMHSKDWLLPLGYLIKETGFFWELALVTALVNKIVETKSEAHIATYSELYKYIYSNGLQETFSLKLMLDGEEAKRIFDLPKGGPLIKTIMNRMFEWQLMNPEKTKAALLEEITADKSKFLS